MAHEEKHDFSLLVYKDIAQDYLNYITQKQTKSMSGWRNALTGSFYSGDHARFFLWDILAGHITNNFLFNRFKKAEHAHFISLMDRIAKLKRSDKTGFFNTLSTLIPKPTQSEQDALFDACSHYFTQQLQSDPSCHGSMKALKRDINHLAKEWGINRRIAFKKKDDEEEYQYRVVDTDNTKEQQKDSTRTMKTKWKRRAKILAFGMAVTDIFIALGGLMACGLAWPLGVMIFIKVFVSINAFCFGYIFAKDDLFLLAKDLALGRFFKIKNPKTGEYEELGRYQKITIGVLSFVFAPVAGICIASLSFTSALPIITLAPAGLAAIFVCCLATAAYVRTIRQVISNVDQEKLKSYFDSLTWQDNESGLWYGFRLFLELLKWTLALGIMSVVAIAGYFLFKDKSIHMVGQVWTGLSAAQAHTVSWGASIVSSSYSFIKWIFGVQKIKDLLGFFENACAAYFSSSNHNAQHVPDDPAQKAERYYQYCSTSVAMLGLGCKSAAIGGFYSDTASKHPLPLPLPPSMVGGTASGFIFAIKAVPFYKSRGGEEPAQPVAPRVRQQGAGA